MLARAGLLVLCLVLAIAVAADLASAGRPRPAYAQQSEVLPSFAPVLASAPAPSPTVTPLPPPIWPPTDARGGAHTTPPVAQTSPRPEPTLSPALWLSPADSIAIHGEVHDGRMFVPMLVDGQRMLFMLGSAGGSSIDAAQSPDANADGIQIPTLQIGDVHMNGLTARVERVASFTRTYLGVAADGIVGQELFARYPVAIDYSAGMVTIYRTSAAAQAARPPGAASFPLQMVGGYPTVLGSVDGAQGTFIVDSALGGYVTLGANFNRARHVVRAGEGLAELRLARPDGEVSGRTARLRNLTLGSVSFDRPVIGVMSSPPSDDRLPDTAGTVGADLLSRMYVIVDEPGGSITLATRGSGQTAQDYDRSGLWLIDRDRLVIVRSVTHSSPAAAAGMHEGDVVVSIDGVAANPDNIAGLRAKLAQSSTHWVSIEFRRGGVGHRAVLVLRSLL